MAFSDIALLAGLFGGGGLGYLLKRYIHWLQKQESIEQRQRRLAEQLEGKEFTDGANTYHIKQLDYVVEKDTWKYRLQKRIPLLCELREWTSITIRSKYVASREYVWDSDDIGEDFDTYLRQVCLGDYPDIEYIDTEYVEDGDAVTRQSTETRLKIHSLNPTTITQVVEQVPTFHTYYFENYAGDSRYQLPH